MKSSNEAACLQGSAAPRVDGYAGALALREREARKQIDVTSGSEASEILATHGFLKLLRTTDGPSVSPVAGLVPIDEPDTDGVNIVAVHEPGALYEFAKRALDIVVGILALIFLLPVIALVSAAIVIEDGGPVLYWQMRTGKNGREFKFYKLRSMVRNADDRKFSLSAANEANGPIFKIQNDPRITRVGRFIRRYSLDELPQLISVISGDMTLVGPRPLYAPEAAQCNARQWNRHLVKPGLLCLREVCGRSRLSFERWMELDLIYLRTRSMTTDLRILLRAIPAVLGSDGAY